MKLTMEELLAEAERLRPAFERSIEIVDFDEKGILPSEMFFLMCAVARAKPKRILECERARGQSTLLLALCFPDAEIISLELMRETEDAEIAAEKLAPYGHVRMLFGDSRRLLPKMTQAGDAAIIDGPKGYRGVKLALATLGLRKPAAVFLHDSHQGSEERRCLERWLPGCLYSDDTRFEKQYAAALDERCWRQVETGDFEGWRPHFLEGEPAVSYGPTYACMPYDPKTSYRRALNGLRAESLMRRTWDSIGKRIGAPKG